MLETCGLYGESYFQIYKYFPQNYSFSVVYETKVFPKKYYLEGAVLFPKNQILYILTWR